MERRPRVRVLAGDIGATNARLALVELHGAEARVLKQQQFHSRDFPGLAPLVQPFRASLAVEPDRACFGIAGPVIEGRCCGPNLPWTVDERELATAIGIPRSSLINDLAAVGHGLALLGPEDIETLQPGTPRGHEAIAVIAPGTGLGHGFLVWDGTRYLVQASEGGHVSFAARDDFEWALLRELRGEFGHVSWERVVSGPGLVRIYQALARSGYAAEQATVREEQARGDPAEVIVRYAADGGDPLCAKALDTFVSLLGAQAGNLALTVCALGGLYLAGGIVLRIVRQLKAGAFLSSFTSKGRLSSLLARIPVHVVLNAQMGVLGAARAVAEFP